MKSEALVYRTKVKDVESERGKIILALLTVYLVWGSAYLAQRIALESLPPFLMSGIRFLVTGTGLYIFLRMGGVPNPKKIQYRNAIMIGGLLFLGGNGGVVFAQQWVSSGFAALMVATTPLWMVLFAGIRRRPPTHLEWAGLALGFAGIVLLNIDHDFSTHPASALALLGATVCWALGSAWSRNAALPSGLMANATEMAAGGVFLLILSMVAGERITEFPSIRSLGGMAYLMVFGSLVGFSAYTYLLLRVRPALATSNAYVNPIIAVILGVWFAGEKVTPMNIIAMVVIVCGVALVVLGQKR